MSRVLFLFIMVIHGLIHIMGFIKAFGIAEVEQLKGEISKPAGLLWLAACIMIVLTSVLYIFKSDLWLITGTIGMLLSIVLITSSWSDARYGTIANIILLAGLVLGYANYSFHNVFLSDIKQSSLQETGRVENVLTAEDISHLPLVVQKYIRYAGALGQPVVHNFRVECNGKIRKDEESEWMPFTTVQYNFLEPSARLFYMKAKMKGLPVDGYHHYIDNKAVMDIRLLSLIKVQYMEGREMDISETVTFLNDMCCMAPATLIDRRLEWSEEKENSVNVKFTNNDISVSATLFFDNDGRLVNFISDDRYAALDNGRMEKFQWLTPLSDFGKVGVNNLARYAEAVYKYPDGDMAYGTFNITSVEHNVHIGR